MTCQWLHEKLEVLPLIKYPYDEEALPKNGIYFFYEIGEIWGHSGNNSRIARIGTHKGDNFGNRISEHYLVDEEIMNFDWNKPKPSDRSIFRNNIGRVLLNQDNNPYLSVWMKNYTERETRVKFGHLRDIHFEKEIESQITNIIRDRFSFRFFIIEDEVKRIGEKGLENRLIGTVGGCNLCKPSRNWFGRNSPVKKIAESRLWQVQHLNSDEINSKDMKDIEIFIQETLTWLES